MMRVPQTGNGGASRLRGALPPGGGTIPSPSAAPLSPPQGAMPPILPQAFRWHKLAGRAAAGKMQRPGRILARQGAAPLRHRQCDATSPYRGGFWVGCCRKGSPARGAGGASRLRGALPPGGGTIPSPSAAPLSPPQGAMPPILPQAFRWHKLAGRAAAGKMQRPGRILARQGAAPLRHRQCDATSPYRGGFWVGCCRKGSPARGAGGASRLRGALPPGGGTIPSPSAIPCPRRFHPRRP